MLIGLFAIFARFDYSKLSKNWFLKALTFFFVFRWSIWTGLHWSIWTGHRWSV